MDFTQLENLVTNSYFQYKRGKCSFPPLTASNRSNREKVLHCNLFYYLHILYKVYHNLTMWSNFGKLIFKAIIHFLKFSSLKAPAIFGVEERCFFSLKDHGEQERRRIIRKGEFKGLLLGKQRPNG